jgi:hypothetical protein
MKCFASSVLFKFVTYSTNQALPNPVPMGIFWPAKPFKMPARLDLNIVNTNYLIKHDLLCQNAS